MAYTFSSTERDFNLEKALRSGAYNVTINDVSLSFAKDPVTGDVLIKDKIEAISQGIKHLLKTRQYEVPFNETFYCDVERHLFEMVNSVTAQAIKTTITDAIKENGDGIVELQGIECIPRPDQNGYSVQITVTPVKEPITITITEFLEVE